MMVAFTKRTVKRTKICMPKKNSNQSESELKNVGNLMNCMKRKIDKIF